MVVVRHASRYREAAYGDYSARQQRRPQKTVPKHAPLGDASRMAAGQRKATAPGNPTNRDELNAKPTRGTARCQARRPKSTQHAPPPITAVAFTAPHKGVEHTNRPRR